MKGYEYLAKLLADYGTTHFFFQEVILRATVKEAEEKYGLKGILAHSEVSAGYMADGYARMSGKVGVCMSQSVGAVNLAAGLGDAWLGVSPVIAITGKKTEEFQNKNCYQETDHTLAFEGVTKFQADATDATQMPRLMRACYAEAASGKPRPVHLDIRGRTGTECDSAEMTEEYIAQSEFGRFPQQRTAADSEMVKKAAAALYEAKKPVIVIGRGAFISDAGEEIAALMEKADIPVVTTPDGKTVIDETHPLWRGIVGSYGMGCANKAVEQCDLVIFIGTQTADQSTCDWITPKPSVHAVQIDVYAGELGKNYPHCVGLLGDAKTVCAQLLKEVKAQKRPEWIKTTRSLLEDTEKKQHELKSSGNTPISTARLCAEFNACLPEDAVLVSDTGYSAIWTCNYFRLTPKQRYLRAAGSLGWSFPAAMGAACATDRPVFCFTGDGGFYYYMSEMETAVREGIKIITVINNNGVFGQCARGINALYGGKPRGVGRITFSKTPFTEIAKQFGFYAVKVEKPEDIAPAIKAAIAQSRPALIEVITDSNIHPAAEHE